MKLAKLKKQPALVGLVVWYSLAWSWALQTDTLNLAGSKKQGMVLAILVLAINVALSVWVMWTFIRIAKNLQRRLPTKLFIPTALLLFAFADFMVAWVPAALWIGPQGRLDSVLPLSSPAPLLVHTPLVYAARFVGYYGLAAFVWMTVYMVSIKKLRKISYLPLLILSILATSGWLLYRNTNGQDIKATLISEKIVDRVPAVKLNGQDLVVFPEYGLEKIDNHNLKDRIQRTSGADHKTYFLGSEQVYKGLRVGHENRMTFGNTTDGITQKQDKFRLIPGGEDLPYIVRTLLRATGQTSTLDYFSEAKGVITGHQQLKVLQAGDTMRIGAALCSSIIAPQDYQAFTRNGANVLTNSASLTTFKGSALFAWEQKSLGRFMAVANSRYFLQSANSASAYAIDNNGHTLAQVYGQNTVDIVAKANSRKTFYANFGEVMVWLGGLITFAYLVTNRRKVPERLKRYLQSVKNWLQS